ncbi:hypothetical protein ABZ079_21190 [Streptomyces sp. NPDC006314]|uniref:hypothetical protein n=1 Tax=Streptomyces sp. NPDC006314 TaxID=3154475 RepID=UPI0033B2D205
MAVDQVPGRVREFVSYLESLMARLDPGGGWCGVFWQRDPEGMRACLDGREVPPWDVVEALLQDLGAAYGPAAAATERRRAGALHVAAITAYDARPGARDALVDRLDVMLREQRYAAERQAELTRLLAAPGSREEAESLRLDLTWAHDDHERATARCAEIQARMAELDRRARDGRLGAPEAPTGRPDSAAQACQANPAHQGADPAQAAQPGHSAHAHQAGPVHRAADAAQAAQPGRSAHAYQAAQPAPAAPAHQPVQPAREVPAAQVSYRASALAGPSAPPAAAAALDPAGPSAPAAQVPYGAASLARSDAPPPAPAKPRKRRRGSARFAGMAEDETAPVAVSRAPEPAGGRRTPRGARFAGAASSAEVVPAPVEAVDDGVGEAVDGAVARLARLRADGRSGEAHALLVEATWWPPARFPLLANALHRAGLGADWVTLLWEAASLPAERLVAAADALAAAGRGADGQQMLRQGVARPAEQIGAAVLSLDDEGRRREARALLDAYVSVRTPEEAARSVAADPGRLVPLLLEAAHTVSDERYWDLVHALRVAGHAT